MVRLCYGLISRGCVRFLFVFIKDEFSEFVGAEVDSKGGGVIYAVVLLWYFGG